MRIFFIVALIHCLLPSFGQDCDVDFPGTSARNFSGACGGSSTSNLNLGKNTPMGNGDTFTFNAPFVDIRGNISVKAQGSGKIVIPAGVTVNVEGNFQLDPGNSGCTAANPCTFEIEVNGNVNFSSNLQNNLVRLVWSGTGKVVVDGNLENSSNGCMECDSGGCPDFKTTSGCSDDGKGCSGKDFCTAILNPCSSDNSKPTITGCPSNQVVNITGTGCTQPVSWTPPNADDNCTLLSFTSSHAPGTGFAVGTTTVTYTATDAAGNSAVCSFDVTVTDNIPPVFTSCSPNIVITHYDPVLQRGVATWDLPEATDNCGAVTLTSSFNAGDYFPKGITLVSYTAGDNSGNTAVCNFEINIVGNNVPTSDAVSVTTHSGQPVEICLNISDPDGDVAGIKDLHYSSGNGQITNLDSRCFTYTSDENFEGNESFSAIICDDQHPQACSAVEIQIHVIPEIILDIYKALTPNSDGLNDVWRIKGIERYPNNKVTVFDRWGVQVYTAEGYDNHTVVWDGMRGGKVVPSGTYFYSVDLNNGTSVFKGFLELVN